jgi:hypothetical protein
MKLRNLLSDNSSPPAKIGSVKAACMKLEGGGLSVTTLPHTTAASVHVHRQLQACALGWLGAGGPRHAQPPAQCLERLNDLILYIGAQVRVHVCCYIAECVGTMVTSVIRCIASDKYSAEFEQYSWSFIGQLFSAPCLKV